MTEVIPIRQEVLIDGTWTDITSRTRGGGNRVTITRGYSGEQANLSSGTATFTVDNRDYFFSDANPRGVNFGKIGRNTQYRCSVQHHSNYLRMTDTSTAGGVNYDGSSARTTDKAVLDITGDIDIRIDCEADDWRGRRGHLLAAKYVINSNQRSWAFFTSHQGYLVFINSTDGTSATRRYAYSTVPMTERGRTALRVTLDVNNGSGGSTVTFYTSDTINGSWTQLGNTVVESGVTSIFASTAPLEIGSANDNAGRASTFTAGLNSDPFTGKIYAFEMRNGIGGTLVADFDPSTRTPGDTSWSDGLATPNTWTLLGSAEISDADYRFWGALSTLPQEWDPTGTDVYVPVQAGDRLQQLTQAKKPLRSAIHRFLSQYKSTFDGWWPMEDDQDGDQIGAEVGMPGRRKLMNSGDSSELPGTGGALTFTDNTGFASGGAGPANTTGTAYVQWYYRFDSLPATEIEFFRIWYSSGNIRYVTLSTDGTSVRPRFYDYAGDLISAPVATLYGTGASPTNWLAMRMKLTQSGANVSWELAWYPRGGAFLYGTSGTLTTRTIGRPTLWQKVPSSDMVGLSFCHVFMSRQDFAFTGFGFVNATNAYVGETAYERFSRLADEEGVGWWVIGARWLEDIQTTVFEQTELMGPQRVRRLADLWQECAEVTGGMLYAPRDKYGVTLRIGRNLYNRDPLELDYSAGVISPPLRPVRDDTQIRNDVTARRVDGSFFRTVRESGPLNVNDPEDDPQGVGLYDVAVERNVYNDTLLRDQGYWERALGTWDEVRIPRVRVDLHRSPFTADPTLLADTAALDLGQPLSITNPPLWLPPEDILLYVRGSVETLANMTRTIEWNTAPYGPYLTARWTGGGLTTRRLDSRTTTLNASYDSDDVSLVFTFTDRADRWSTTAEPYDVMIAGERMTVTSMGAVTGSGPWTQTATVTRSVNGIVKAQTAGTPVHIFMPARWAK